MIHAGIETSIFVHLDGHDLYEVALDGIPLKELRKWESAKGGSVELEPGYRSDVLVRASTTPGTYCLYNEIPPSRKEKALRKRAVTRTNLALIVVEGDPVTTSPDITSAQFANDLKTWATDYLTNKIPKLKDIDPSEITGKRKLTFDAVGPKAFYIDNRTFDENRPPDQVITLGAVEEWTITAINDSHPFHIHVNPFLVQERYPDNTLKWVWRDTFFVHEGETATIRSRFLDFDGRTVLHCHNLDHEDLGMMQVVQIVKNVGGAAPASARGLSSLPRPTPDWALEDADGRRLRRSDYDERALLLVFHRGLDCLHCAEQITALARSASRFRALGVELAAVSPRWPDLDALRAARERLGIDFPLLADPNLEVFRRYGCQGDPPFHGAFLIDADGQVRWQSVSDQPEADMDRLVDLARRHLASGQGRVKQGVFPGSENQTPPMSPSQTR
jgi:peroxiredoxin